MAPAKKMAKKAAKKVAKKAAKKSAKHTALRDMRRAYEHLGRVEILQRSGEIDAEVAMLVSLAQREIRMEVSQGAADLLRAAEHLSFASLGERSRRGGRVSDELRREIELEVDHLIRRAAEDAEEDGERYEEVVRLAEVMVERARTEVGRGAYRVALELARGAEALAHVFRPQSRIGVRESRGRLAR